MSILLFIFGASFGSFLCVIADRYDPERFLFSGKILGWPPRPLASLKHRRSGPVGRSHCVDCGATLRWFELVPVFSFFVQRGHCRNCGAKLSLKYPVVEILSGLIFVFVPLRLQNISYLPPTTYYIQSALWISAFLVLLLITLIDLRLSIIPDEANILLGIVGVLAVSLSQPDFGLTGGSFLGPYALLFGWRSNIWLNHVLAGLFGGTFFAFIIFLTRGRGMGMGDLKLALPLGFLFGWPDIVLIVGLGFIFGSICGVWMMVKKVAGLKSLLPFGPFLAISAATVFFFGHNLLSLYFGLFSL